MRPDTAGSPDQLLRHCQLPRVEARALLESACGRDRSWLIAHGNEALPADTVDRFDALVSARQTGRPIAYLVGQREFYGRSFLVNDSVLIPRPETELIVDWALSLDADRVLDLGTGSGILAVTLALAGKGWRLEASDMSPAALALARTNAGRLNASIDAWHRGDWWSAVPAGSKYDLVVANPPYIAALDQHLAIGDLRFEPQAALAAGASGLEAIDAIIAGAELHLCSHGWLLLEHGFDQAASVRKLLENAGFMMIETRQDLAGLDRITGGRWRTQNDLDPAFSEPPIRT